MPSTGGGDALRLDSGVGKRGPFHKETSQERPESPQSGVRGIRRMGFLEAHVHWLKGGTNTRQMSWGHPEKIML